MWLLCIRWYNAVFTSYDIYMISWIAFTSQAMDTVQFAWCLILKSNIYSFPFQIPCILNVMLSIASRLNHTFQTSFSFAIIHQSQLYILVFILILMLILPILVFILILNLLICDIITQRQVTVLLSITPGTVNVILLVVIIIITIFNHIFSME